MIELSKDLQELIQDYREACYLGEWDDSDTDKTQSALELGIQKAINDAVVESADIFYKQMQRLIEVGSE